MDNYERARAVLIEHKPVLLKIADELLAREVLDADQVLRLAKGLPLEDPPPPSAPRVRRRRRAANRRPSARRSCRRSASQSHRNKARHLVIG